jgi:ribonuclease HI
LKIDVYSDGSATTNDKPGGYGWVMTIDGIKHSEGNGHMERASNNDAELEAAIQGLRAAFLYITARSTFPEELHVTLVSDSQLVLGWASGLYKFKQQDKLEKYGQLQGLVQKMRVKTRWVEGHSGDEHNERCDRLANEARLGASKQADKIEAIIQGNTLIGNKKLGVVCLWYKNTLKVLDLENNIVEDYDRTVHGTRGGILEVREDKLR